MSIIQRDMSRSRLIFCIISVFKVCKYMTRTASEWLTVRVHAIGREVATWSGHKNGTNCLLA